MPTAREGYKLADGTKVPSVTTVCGGLGWSTGALQYWAWDLGRQGFAYKDLMKQAATIGTITHERIEFDLLGNPWVPQADYDPQDIAASDDPFSKYLEWKKGFEIVVVLAEKSLTSERLRFGGTPDFLVLMRPAGSNEKWRLVLIDIKTSKAIYASHIAQVAAYCELIEDTESELVKTNSASGYIESVMILQVGRKEGEFQHKEIPEEMLSAGWGLFRDLLSLHTQKPLFDKFCAVPKKEKKAKKEEEQTEEAEA